MTRPRSYLLIVALVSILTGATPVPSVQAEPAREATLASTAARPESSSGSLVRAEQAPPGAQALPASRAAAAAFARLRHLAGRWQAESSKGWSDEVTFEVIARGSAVVQRTAFADHPDETMVTVYYLDGERLLLTHFCEARNQPRLVASETAPERIAFEFLDATNLPSRDHGHMDRAVYSFLDDDHFSSRWTWYQDGAERWLEEIVYQRLSAPTKEAAGR
jgi:hypothetical protein